MSLPRWRDIINVTTPPPRPLFRGKGRGRVACCHARK